MFLVCFVRWYFRDKPAINQLLWGPDPIGKATHVKRPEPDWKGPSAAAFAQHSAITAFAKLAQSVGKSKLRMASRRLRATPSTPSELSDFQMKLLSGVDVLFNSHQQDREPLSASLSSYELQYKDKPELLAAKMIEVLVAAGFSQEVVEGHVKSLFPVAEVDEYVGMRTLSLANFSFQPASLWRGQPANHTIRKLSRSMIVSGFRPDSVISSRTLRFSGVPFSLSLGDGSARAIAAMLVWRLIGEHISDLSATDERDQHLVWSLSGVSVNFERHGSGSATETLIAQASRQNQAAAVLPVSTVQWLNMIRDFLGEPLGHSFKGTSQVQQVMETIVESYNKHAEVMAYDVDAAPVRKKRRSKTGTPAADELGDVGLKIGRRRILSMKHFLSGANDEALEELVKHIVIVGDYKCSVMSDEIMQCKVIYVGSRLPKERLPTPAQLCALHAAGDVAKTWVQDDSALAAIQYDVPLSTSLFAMLWRKMIKTHEAAIEGMTSHEAKAKERPSEEDWIVARKVVQLWDLTIEGVAAKHMSKSDFDVLKNLVLESKELDAELAGILDRMPKYFHMGLIPSIASDEGESIDAKHKRIAVAHSAAETAAFAAFKDELQLDWDTVKAGARAQAALSELLSWLEIQHRREQARIGEELVAAYCRKNFPMITVTEWLKTGSQISLLRQAFDKSRLMSIVIVDFNVPGSRDTIKMPSMINAAAEMVKILGAQLSVLWAIMPNAPKEGSKSSAFEDEATISKLLAKAGFSTQERVRQVLDMPPNISNKVSCVDWFVDGRLCCLGDSAENFWMVGSELSRTKIVPDRVLVADPEDLIDSCSLEADDDLNTGERYGDVNQKLAQRGCAVAKAQLSAILAKTKRGCTDWLSPRDTVLIVDLTPYVGDRALATFELKQELKAEVDLVHCIVQAGRGGAFKQAEYTAKRIAQKIASLWFESKLDLVDGNGHVVKVNMAVPDPTPAQLASHPGATIAFKGLRTLDFKVCVLAGNKLQLRADKISAFSGCSQDILNQVTALKQKHDAEYTNFLEGCLKAETPGPDETLIDWREGDAEHEETDDTANKTLMSLDSIEVLKSNFATAECSSTIKGVKIFRDVAKKVVFLYAKSEDVIIKVGDCIGGIGGGTLLDSDTSKSACVPWLLPAGDKTWVQRSVEKGEEDEAGKKPKFVSGTLYSILRELDRRSTEPITLTSYGQVTSVSESGRQEYRFKNEAGTDTFRRIDFHLTPPKANAKLSSGNFFAPLVDRDNGLGGGVLQLTWRLVFDQVGHTLKPTKVYVTAKERFLIPKGKPVKVCWPDA